MDHGTPPAIRGKPAAKVMADTGTFKLRVPGSLDDLRVIDGCQHFPRDPLPTSHIDHTYIIIIKSIGKQKDMEVPLHIPVQPAFAQVYIGVSFQIDPQNPRFAAVFVTQTLHLLISSSCKRGRTGFPILPCVFLMRIAGYKISSDNPACPRPEHPRRHPPGRQSLHLQMLSRTGAPRHAQTGYFPSRLPRRGFRWR